MNITVKIDNYLNENKNITLYHGDNYKTTKLKPSLMMQERKSNNQEGVGIYFSDLSVAKDYGKNIISINVDPKKFIPSRDTVGKHISTVKRQLLIKKVCGMYPDDMFYLISDYVEISIPEDITDSVIKNFVEQSKNEEVRNFQISLARAVGVESFVNAWNKILPDVLGTYENNIYCVINTSININNEL